MVVELVEHRGVLPAEALADLLLQLESVRSTGKRSMTELLPGGRSAAAAASTSSLALPPFLNVADHILPWLRTFMRPSAASRHGPSR